MKRVKLWLCGLIIVGVVFAWQSDAAEREFSLSGAVYRGSEPDLGLTDLWLTTLSKQPALKVLDRADMRVILGELSLAGTGEDSARQVRLGRLLGVEYFAWLKVTDDQALMEVVEAATGRGITVVPLRFAKGQIVESLPKLAEQAVEAISRPRPVPSQVAPSLAISIPRFAASNEAVQASVETIIANFSKETAKGGITILPRRFAADAVRERWLQEKGLVENIAEGREFEGADYIFGVTIDVTNEIEFLMLETSTGRRVGRIEMSMKNALTANGLKALVQWGLERLAPRRDTVFFMPPATGTRAHNVAFGRLKPLYAGMLLHNQGRYFDAIMQLRTAQGMQGSLDENMKWVASCYRWAGFPEIADGTFSLYSIDRDAFRNVMRVFQGYIKYNGGNLRDQSKPGIILLGVTSGTGVPRALAGRMGVLLLNSLNKSSKNPVIAAEDIEELRDEYDLLLGINQIKGTAWQRTPSALVKDAVTAHLESGKKGLYLRLCLIQDFEPASICDVVTNLPANPSEWSATIDKQVGILLTMKDSAQSSWTPPPVIIEETQTQLVDQLENSLRKRGRNQFDMETYCKALVRDHTLTKYRANVPWRDDLEHWFLRVLPQGHEDYPVTEFYFAYTLQDFQRLAKKYPNNPVGIFSRYNAALMSMTPANFDATQIEISAVKARLESLKLNDFVPRVAAMDSALRCVLGLPGGKPEDAFLNGDLIKPNRADAIESATSSYNCGLIIGSFLVPNKSEQVRVDLEALCLMKQYEVIPSRFLRRFIDQQGSSSELTQYAVLKYVDIMTSRLGRYREWTYDDLDVIYNSITNLFFQVKARAPSSIAVYVTRDMKMMNTRDLMRRYAFIYCPAATNKAFQQALCVLEKTIPVETTVPAAAVSTAKNREVSCKSD